MDQLVNFLAKYIEVEQKDINVLKDFIQIANLSKSEYFLKSGNICHDLIFLNEGIMQIIQHVEGNNRTTNFFTSGDLFTSSPSFQLKVPADGSIMALTDVNLILISKKDLEDLFSKGQKWERLGRLIAEKQLIEMINLKNSYNYKSPKERLMELVERIPIIMQVASQQQISSYLGISRSHYNRILNEKA